jgi:uncharacterized protein YcnI
MKKTIFSAVAVLWLVVTPQAMAHAKIKPAETPADGVARIVLEVPGEESVPATRVAVQLPRGVSLVELEPTSGWKSTIRGRVVTWSGGAIDRDEVGRFTFRARMPNSPGEEIVFPTVQTYANGLIARWIGAPGSEMPAPRLMLVAAKPKPKPLPPPPPPSDPPPQVTTTGPTPSQDDGDDDSVAWLLAGGIIVGLGALGVAVLRRRRA